jgi:hypothetical protein
MTRIYFDGHMNRAVVDARRCDTLQSHPALPTFGFACNLDILRDKILRLRIRCIMEFRNLFAGEYLMLQKVILLVALLLMASAVNAQETVALNELKIGTITAESPSPSFRFTAAAGQSLQVEVVEVAAGLAPQFSITNASGALVQAVGNLGLSSQATDTVTFVQAGDYLISISSASSMTGQFVVRISAAEPAVPAQTLSVGTPISGTLTSGENITYALNGDPLRPLVLTVNGGVGVTLTNGAGQIAAILSTPLEGGAFNLPASAETYQLELLNDLELVSAVYAVALNPADTPVPIATSEVSAPDSIVLPVLPVSGDCMLATLDAGEVNVRWLPTTDSEVITTISPANIYFVIGRNPDSSWYEIDVLDEAADHPGSGWVAAFVTRRGGDCSNVQVSYIPPTATPEVPPTLEATPQIAGDNEVVAPFSYARDISMGFSGALSYPQGNNVDTITYTLIDIPSPVPGRPEFRYRIACEGTGVEYAEVRWSDGSTSPCDAGSNYVSYLTNSSPRSGTFSIGLRSDVASFGADVNVTWRVQFTWYIP